TAQKRNVAPNYQESTVQSAPAPQPAGLTSAMSGFSKTGASTTGGGATGATNSSRGGSPATTASISSASGPAVQVGTDGTGERRRDAECPEPDHRRQHRLLAVTNGDGQQAGGAANRRPGSDHDTVGDQCVDRRSSGRQLRQLQRHRRDPLTRSTHQRERSRP